MTDAEYIKTIPTLTNKELLEELDYCGYDSYYRTIREPVIDEITKRLNHIAELEKENAELKTDNDARKFAMAMSEKVEKQLREENAELKAKNKWYSEQVCNKECAEVWGNLDKAKEIIRKLYAVYYDPCVTESDLKYRDELFVEIKQFLKNDGCPDVMCEDCSKEDCEIKKLGLVEVEK